MNLFYYFFLLLLLGFLFRGNSIFFFFSILIFFNAKTISYSTKKWENQPLKPLPLFWLFVVLGCFWVVILFAFLFNFPVYFQETLPEVFLSSFFLFFLSFSFFLFLFLSLSFFFFFFLLTCIQIQAEKEEQRKKCEYFLEQSQFNDAYESLTFSDGEI